MYKKKSQPAKRNFTASNGISFQGQGQSFTSCTTEAAQQFGFLGAQTLMSKE